MTPLVDLTGKRGLIVGIANKQSIAAGCAQAFRQLVDRYSQVELNSGEEVDVDSPAKLVDADERRL